MTDQKTILVAPLNWGLGHATRCIPIISALIKDGFKVIIGGDGTSLDLLKHEFPQLSTVTLPSYNIEYSREAGQFKTKMFLQSPRLISAIRAEHKVVERLVAEYQIDGIISDNRLGLYTAKVPTVFITHQLQVLSGITTKFTTFLHNRYIKRFDECWVPDFEKEPNLSGILGHPEKNLKGVRYLGPLSRFKKSKEPILWDVLAVLSGPEPQRTILEEKLIPQLKKYSGKVLIVRGVVEDDFKKEVRGNLTILNFLSSKKLESVFNQSALVISRSGYTTIMDLAKLGKKAFFIPTPGQAEQEYLASRLKDLRIAPFKTQEEFRLKDLAGVSVYKGFEEYSFEKSQGLVGVFGLFKCERKLRTDSKLTLDVNTFIVRLDNMLHNRKTEA